MLDPNANAGQIALETLPELERMIKGSNTDDFKKEFDRPAEELIELAKRFTIIAELAAHLSESFAMMGKLTEWIETVKKQERDNETPA